MRTAMIALAFVAFSFSASAADDELYGTYKLISRTRTILDTGQIITLDQEHGFISYGQDGRMMVLSVRGNRPKPESVAKMTDQSAASIHDRVRGNVQI